MMKLNTERLLAFLEGGETDPLVAGLLERDPTARQRLALLREVRQVIREAGSPPRAPASISPQRAPRAPADVGDVFLDYPALQLADIHRPRDIPADRNRFLAGLRDSEPLGTLHLVLPPDEPWLWFEPGPKSGARLPDHATEKTALHIAWRRYTLDLRLHAEDDMLRLALELTDLQASEPCRGLAVLLVPLAGRLLRVDTDEEGRATLPMRAAPGRLRIEAETTLDLELVVHAGG